MNFFEALLIPPGSADDSLQRSFFEVTGLLETAKRLLSTQDAELATAKAEIEQLRKEKEAAPNVTVEEDVPQIEHENETKLLKALLIFVSKPTSAFNKDEFIQFEYSWTDFMRHCISRKGMDTKDELTELLKVAVAKNGVGRPDWASVKVMLVSKTGDIRMILRFNNKGDMVTKYANLNPNSDNMLFVPDAKLVELKRKSSKWCGFKIVQPDENNEAARQTTMLARVPKFDQAGDLKETVPDEFTFERILTNQTQEDVYTEVEPFIFSAMQGKDVGLFAYGGTGTGKTYTMGTEAGVEDVEKRGIMPRILESLLENKNIIKASLQVIEIIPGVEVNQGINPLFRVLDLIDLTYGHRRGNTEERVGMFNENRNPTKDTYFYTPILKGPKAVADGFKMDQCTFNVTDSKTNLYNSGNQISDCNEATKQVSVPEGFESYVFKEKGKGHSQLTPSEILTQYNKYINNRRAIKTIGNTGTANMEIGGSSRTHLLTTIEITMGNKSSKIFVVDLAGREAEDEDTSSAKALTKGINKTLQSLTNLIGQKSAFPISTSGRNSGVLGAMKKWESSRYTGAENSPKNDPLMILTAPLWQKVDSKIMMIVCAYPISSQDQNPFDFQDYTRSKTKNDGWKEFLGFKEDGFLKFKRDFDILQAFSKIQKKEVKYIDVDIQEQKDAKEADAAKANGGRPNTRKNRNK
jgi:hypothetical protein